MNGMDCNTHPTASPGIPPPFPYFGFAAKTHSRQSGEQDHGKVVERGTPRHMSSAEKHHLGGCRTKGKGQKEYLKNQGHRTRTPSLLSHVEAVKAPFHLAGEEGKGLGSDITSFHLCTAHSCQRPDPGQMLRAQTRSLSSGPDPFNSGLPAQKGRKAKGGPQDLSPAFPVRTVDGYRHTNSPDWQ